MEFIFSKEPLSHFQAAPSSFPSAFFVKEEEEEEKKDQGEPEKLLEAIWFLFN